MLVLSRMVDEGIYIGPDQSTLAQVVIIAIRGDKVRLGIEAPREWIVGRREVFDAIRKANPPTDASE